MRRCFTAFCLFHLCTPVNTMCHVSAEIGFICRSTPETQEIGSFLRSRWKKVTGWEGRDSRHSLESISFHQEVSVKQQKQWQQLIKASGLSHKERRPTGPSGCAGCADHWALRVCRLHRTLCKGSLRVSSDTVTQGLWVLT